MKTPTITVAVVGAGPAGMMAALEARRAGARVLLLDGNPRVGRKLLVTGSGRCNLSNANVRAAAYHCTDTAFVAHALERFGHAGLLARLTEMGIPTYATDDGWTYPVSNSAANVVDLFEAHLALAGVDSVLNTRVTGLRREGTGYRLTTAGGGEPIRADRVILAGGGMAYPTLGSRGDLFPLAEALGHTVLPVTPALAPLLTDPRPLRRLQGVRLDAHLTLSENGTLLAQTTGNIIFTEWGINGPGVMDLSHHVSARPNTPMRLEIDFLHRYAPEMRRLFAQYRDRSMPLGVMLEAVLPSKVAAWMVEKNHLPLETRLDELTREQEETLFHWLTAFHVEVRGTRGFEFSQVSTGGIPLDEVNPESMESLRSANLYFAGEILDVNGPCGGYNLQWAFTSGVIAGAAAGTSQAL